VKRIRKDREWKFPVWNIEEERSVSNGDTGRERRFLLGGGRG